MLALVMSLAMVTATDSPSAMASMKNQPTRICREMGGAGSRSEAIKICRTHEEWLAWDGCHGATRYCTPQMRAAMAGRETAFPMNEDSRIICRKLTMTGTRLKTVKACLAKREWDRMWQESADETRKLQDFSKRGPSGSDR